MKFKAKYFLIFFVGFFLGTFIFFPWNQLRERLVAILSQQTGQRVQMEDLQAGTGLGLGLKYGSLFAMHAKGFEIMAMGAPVHCDELTLAPKFWPLLLGKMHVGIECVNDKKTWFTTLIEMSPFWSPSKIQLDAQFKEFPLAPIAQTISMEGLEGNLMGLLKIKDLPMQGGFPKDIQWDLSIQKLILPSSNNQLLKLPSIEVGDFMSQGKMNSKQLIVNDLRFGSQTSPIKGGIKANLGLNNELLPNSGELRGELITDENFEKEKLKDISLDLFFGKIKSPGKRVFVKKIKGSYLSLLAPPEND